MRVIPRNSFYRAFIYLVLVASIMFSSGFSAPQDTKVQSQEAIRFLNPYAYLVDVHVVLENIGDATATSGYVDLPIPQSNPPFFFTKDVIFSPEISKTLDDGYNSVLGRVNFSNVKAGEQFEIIYSYRYQTHNYIVDRYDLEVYDYYVEDKALKYFTEPQPLVESNAPEIIEIGKYLSAKSTNIFDLTKEIKAYMREKIKYDRSYNGENGALWALKNGKGDCSEFSALFTAIMRSLGIPTRIVTGFMAENYPQTTTEIDYIDTLHAIVEIYVPGIGWVPNEPQELDEIEFLPGKAINTPMENLTDPNYLVLIEDQNYQLKDHGGFWYYYDDVNVPAEIQFSKASYAVITPVETWTEEEMPEIWVDNNPPEIEVTGLKDKYDAETNQVNIEISVKDESEISKTEITLDGGEKWFDLSNFGDIFGTVSEFSVDTSSSDGGTQFTLSMEMYPETYYIAVRSTDSEGNQTQTEIKTIIVESPIPTLPEFQPGDRGPIILLVIVCCGSTCLIVFVITLIIVLVAVNRKKTAARK